MKFGAGVLTGVLVTLFAGGVGAGAWWIVTAKPPPEVAAAKPPPAATVAKPVKEEDLNTVRLTPDAERRLAVRCDSVKREAVSRARLYGGEVTVPAGRTILVAAPLGGTLQAPDGGADAVPRPGQQVRKGQQVFTLRPLLTPEARTTLAAARVDADGQVKNAETQQAATRVALDRAQRLLREEAGSKRAVDEGQAQYDLAVKTLEAAQARRDLLAQALGALDQGTAAPISIESPQDGMLRNVAALPGQNVPAGAALFEVVDLSQVWVRVPVYVGDLEELAPAADATVGGLSAPPGAAGRAARRVTAAPPSANPQAATVDWYYQADNRAPAAFTPGERVGVSLPLRGEEESLTVPWSAVVHDIHGGAWVYEQTAPYTYARRRVTVRYTAGGAAVLATGPPPGTLVVTAGAQELFGVETGFSK